MTPWSGPFARRRGDRSAAVAKRLRDDGVPSAGVEPAEEEMPDAPEGLLVEDHDGLLLLRTPSDDTLTPADVADLARSMRNDDGTVTVIAGAEGMEAAAFWPRLSELLDSLSESGTETVRLVMAGAGHDIKDRPATARRIADAWGFEVKAPDGPPLVVPGGSLFVPPAPEAVGKPSAGGWWRFAPGANPEPLGPRSPEPSWQPALRGVPSGTAGGSVVEQIPAGLLVRPAEATPAQPGDLYHAVPVDPRRPAVVIGVPYGEDVSAEEVAEVLEALPEEVRSGVRLAPGGRRDVLPLAQSVSDRLAADVEVMTGLPLVAAGGPLGAYTVRSVLAAPDGTPKWMPFVDAVVCRPPDGEGRARPPRLLRWTPPLPGPARPEEGVVGLTDRWQVTVTRAGLWLGPRNGPRLSPTARQVDAAGPVIELGMPGELMDASLWPVLSNLLGALTPALRERATLHVHGVSQDGGRELRRLAAQYRLRTLRYAAPAPAPARPRPTAQTLAPAQPQVQVRPGRAATAGAPPAPAPAPGPAHAPVSTGGTRPATAPVRGTGRPERAAAAEAGSAGAVAPAARPGAGTGPGPGQGPQTESARPGALRPGQPGQPGLPSRPAQSGQPGQAVQPVQPGQTRRPGPSGKPDLPLRPLQPGRTAGSGPARLAEGTGRAARAERARQLREAMAAAASANRTTDGRAERARQLREAMAAGTAAGTDASASASTGAPGRTPGAGAGTAGVPAGAGALGAPGTPRTPEMPGTPPDLGGQPELDDWSDDPVPIGSLGRPRRPGAAGEPTSGTAAGPTVPAPAEQREPAERHGAPEPAEEKDARTPTPDADRSAAPMRAARPGAGEDAGAEPGAGTESDSAGPDAPAGTADPRRADGPQRPEEPSRPGAAGPGRAGDSERDRGPGAVGGPVAADGARTADGAETADGVGTGHGPVLAGGPERVDGPARADAPTTDDGSDAAGGPSQADDAVRTGASARTGGTEATDAAGGPAPTDEPGPNGEPFRAPGPGAHERAVEDDRPAPSGPAEPQGNGRDGHDGRDGRDGRDAQADLPGASGPRAAGPRTAGPDASGPAKEENPASTDGPEPPATRGPAEEPASDPRSSWTEAPVRPDDVPPPKSVRAESGTPADPAPATPPTSPGAMASRDLTAGRPADGPDGSSTAGPTPAPDEPGRGRGTVRPDVSDASTEPGGARTVRDEAGEAGESAQIPDASETPGTPGTPDAPDVPDAPGIPEVPDAGTDALTESESEAEADDADVAQDPLPPVPLDPGHRSSEVERTAFRALAEGMWDRHGAAVARSLARMPALRGKEQEAARADLIALRMYLHISEGPLSHGAVTRALRDYEPDMLPYGACVASALNRLPSYRGAVLRGTGSDPTADGSGVPALPRRGTLLRDAALLSTTPLDPTRTSMMPGGSYVIWSATGRRVRQLSDHSRGPEEVVFAPGTLFRVLDVRRDGPSVQIFLRELTGPAAAATPDPEADRAVLARLDDVVRGRSAAPEGTGHWPERCVGAVGAGP
ncbi:hypothetical protein GCM10009654_17170 [Streptomyces hebeiensis]|uniref:NAD(+)--protein-arginine ADP-ribosyltransferase n=1 Tax=Streptomyces hebeiensis TaxID=229486 RepID=A0ABN1UQP7_9ACTN